MPYWKAETSVATSEKEKREKRKRKKSEVRKRNPLVKEEQEQLLRKLYS